jgi:hypothetical protein
MGVLQHLHIAKYLFKYSSILPLPFGVISGGYYTGLNINTAVWCRGNLEFARGIQEMKSNELKQDTNAGFWF